MSEIEEPAEDTQPFQYGGDQLGGIIHSFSKAPKLLAHFRKSLLRFPRCGDNENYFYSSVILGLFYVKNGGAIPKDLDEARQGLLFGAVHLERIKKQIKLDHSVFGFVEKCMLLNDVLVEHFGRFLRLYEVRNKFRYQLRKKIDQKNKLHSEVSACVQRKFNGYQYVRTNLNFLEKKQLMPIDIVYDPAKNCNTPIYCYFAPDISLAFVAYFNKGEKMILSSENAPPRQCHFYENFFKKTKKEMEVHVKVCAGQSGFTYKFDNPVINYRDNFSKIRDLPFAVYYDLETTTGAAIEFDAKMYVISYSIVVAFHPSLNIPRLVIYRSFDQTIEELNSKRHFDLLDSFSHEGHLDKNSRRQFNDIAYAVYQKSNNPVL